MSKPIAALIGGIVFGTGLSVSGMSDPEVVLGFLTVDGGWNPALLLVMASAVTVTALGYLAIGRRSAPLFDTRFHPPARTAIDGRLLLGAIIFGIGWGVAGYCPGPAIVGAFTLDPRALVFLPGFIVGMLAFEGLPKPAPPQIQ
ncbi:MAG: YeeE/YedE family protein [Gammaproteobacteria bacterium]|nr:YeeE/YedE family protein [Gammaproteobacteria bacterium]